jgi:hypothetical protein
MLEHDIPYNIVRLMDGILYSIARGSIDLQETAEEFHSIRYGIGKKHHQTNSGEHCISPQRVGDQSWFLQSFLMSLPEDKSRYQP